MIPNRVLERFDALLAERKLRFEAVVIGGTALNLLGVVSRPTNDCDVLSPSIPEPVLEAAGYLAARLRSSGEPLDDLSKRLGHAV